MVSKKEIFKHSLILFVTIGIFLLIFLFEDHKHIHTYLHSHIELFGTVVALVTSFMIYLKSNTTDDRYLVPLSMSFLSMGILDGLHSYLDPGDAFVFSHSVASLYGAVFVSFVWMPSFLEIIHRNKLFFLVLAATISAVTAFLTVSFEQWPSYFAMLNETSADGEIVNVFSNLAVFINVAAGVLFISSSAYFYRLYFISNKKVDLLFSIFLFLLGLAEIIFKFSTLWSHDWWFWHLIRLVAFLVVLIFLIYDYQTFLKLLIDREKELIEKNRLIEESEFFLKNIFDINPNILFTSDGIRNIHSVNKAFLEFTGFSSVEKFKAKHSCICDMFENREGFLSKLMDENTSWVQYVLKNPAKTHRVLIIKDDIEYILKVNASHFRFNYDDMYLISLNEITDIERLREKAEASSKAKSTFLSNMSHEIRTPLNGIIGLTELTMDTSLTSKQKYYLSRVKVASKSLLHIINEILDYSKIQAGKIELESETFNILNMLDNISGLFGYEVEKKGLELFFHIDKNIPYGIIGDQVRLTQVLINLIGNAIKFTDTGEIVIEINVVSVNDKECELKFEVRDTGIGIKEENQHKLFKEFSQVDGSYQRKYGGTGLGLAISRNFIQLMGGDISLSSTYGVGTSFSFNISFDIDENILADFNIRNIKKGDRVLVVDDSYTSREIIREVTESWKMDVTLSANGLDALEKINKSIEDKNLFDFMFVDWKMPGLSGVEAVDKIRELYKQSNIELKPVIIMVTAYSKDELVEELQAHNLQDNNILIKPVTPSTIFNAMTNKKQKTPTQISVTKDTDLLESIHGADVLLVEDNEINQLVAKDFLERFRLNVTVANNGEEAVYLVENNSYDIILMDLQMPVMDGIQATKEIRKLEDKKDIPIIAMTAAVMEQDRENSKNAGMDAHISKPIDIDELKNTLIEYIEPDKKTRIIKKENVDILDDNAFSSELEQIDGVNLEELFQKLGGNKKLVFNLLMNFANKYENIEDAFDVNVVGTEDFNAFIHSLKGESGNLAIDGVYRLARIIDERSDFEKKVRFIKPLQHILSDVIKNIKDTMDLKNKNNTESTLQAKDIIEELNEFLSDVDKGYIIAFEKTEELFETLKNVVKDEDLKKLTDAFEKLDYKLVKEILVSIKQELIKRI